MAETYYPFPRRFPGRRPRRAPLYECMPRRATLGNVRVSLPEAAQQALLSYERSLAGLEGFREDINAEFGRATTIAEVNATEKRLLTQYTKTYEQQHVRIIAVYRRGTIEGVPAAKIVAALNPEAGKPIDMLSILGGTVADSAVELAATAGLVSKEDYDDYRKTEGLQPKKYPGEKTKYLLYAGLGAAALAAYFLLKGK